MKLCVGAEEYYRGVLQWIICNWNAEIRSILGVAGWISVMFCWPDSGQLGVPTVLRRSFSI